MRFLFGLTRITIIQYFTVIWANLGSCPSAFSTISFPRNNIYNNNNVHFRGMDHVCGGKRRQLLRRSLALQTTKFSSNSLVREKELINYGETIIENHDRNSPFSQSREILRLCEDEENNETLEAIISYLVTTSLSSHEEEHISLTSLLSPRDQTFIVKDLGSRGLYYSMNMFLKSITNTFLISINGGRDIDYTNMQYAYTAAITALSRSQNQKHRTRAMLALDEMDKFGIPPNSFVITALFLSVDGGKAARALMKRCRTYPNFDMNVFIYNAAIYACSRGLETNGWQSALSYFREMPKLGIQPNQQTYASLLQTCAKYGQVKVAFSIFNEMKNTPDMGVPSAKVWNALIRACSVAGDWPNAIKLLLDMNRQDVDINVIHMNSVLAAISKNDIDEIATDVLNAMQSELSVRSLESLLPNRVDQKVCNNDKYDQLLPFPDLVSVNTVMKSFAMQGNRQEAVKMLGRLKNNEFQKKEGSQIILTLKPDIISYNLVLSTIEEVEDSVKLLHEIRMTRKTRDNPLKPSCQTYSTVISTCTRSNPPDLVTALSLLRDARTKDGLKPNEFMYSAVIWTAEKCRDAKAALTILRRMEANKCKPNTICYNGVLATFAVNGFLKETLSLFYEMKREYVQPSSITFQQIALAATRSNLETKLVLVELEKVLSKLNQQERTAQCSGSIYQWLIQGYGSIRRFDDAFRIFDSLDQTDEMCLSTILFVCSVSKPARWKEAVMIIHTCDIVENARGPGKIESRALSYGIIACSKENEWQEALKIIDLYGIVNDQRGALVSVDAVNSLIAAAGRCGRPDMSIMLLNEMKSKYNIVPNERSFRSAIIACNQAEHEKRRRRNKILTLNREQFGKECHSMKEEALQPDDPLSLQWWEAALSLFRRMKEAGLIPSIHSSSSVIAACEAAGQWQRAIGILQSMTETCTNGDIDRPKPNLYCYNAALAACEKGNAWLEAIDIYERMKAEGGYVKPNFISLNSVSIALDKNEQKELAESIYTEALKANIVKPWKYTKETNSDKITRALDLHQFSLPLAKIAVRNVIDTLLNRDDEHIKDLIIVVGKGKKNNGATKLMPGVKQLLREEYDIHAMVEKTNVGRLRIKSETLCNCSQRSSRRQR